MFGFNYLYTLQRAVSEATTGVVLVTINILQYLLVSPGILVLESLAAGSHDRLPTPLERDLAEA
jgi:hypothetical protein